MEVRLDDSASFTGGLKNPSKGFKSNMSASWDLTLAVFDAGSGQKARQKASCTGKMEHDADWEINPKEIELKEAVGSGNSGTVHRAMWLGSTVAVKV